jgi:biopolymer transport protein ExbB
VDPRSPAEGVLHLARGTHLFAKGPLLKLTRIPLLLAVVVSLAGPALAAEAASPPAEAERSSSLIGGAWDLFQKGGPIMYPIALAAVVGVAFVIERAVALRRQTALPDSLVDELSSRIERLDVTGAMAVCEERPCALARIVRAALLRRSGTIQEMEKAAEDAGVRELWLMRRNVRPIGIIASLSPLLGLLGTILGMIGAFKTMSTGDTMGNPSAFAGAIHQALFTTFFGLSVAIPMLPFFFWLRGKAEALICEIEEVTGDLLLRFRERRMQSDTSELQAAGGTS